MCRGLFWGRFFRTQREAFRRLLGGYCQKPTKHCLGRPVAAAEEQAAAVWERHRAAPRRGPHGGAGSLCHVWGLVRVVCLGGGVGEGY